MKKLIFTLILATLLWAIMFNPMTASYVNFWWMMTGSASILAMFASMFNSGWWKKISLTPSNIIFGIGIAITLWGIFWIGDKLSQLLFHFARPQVDQIYGMKDGESTWLLTALMLFLIGPAEEIFWRGYIQQQLSMRWNPNVGFIITTAIYALVHASSFNFMLTMAALVAGFVWGLLYRFYPEKLGAIIISHALWDVAVFIWFPI